MPTEREQFVALLVKGDLAVAYAALDSAIHETLSIIGQPFDGWRERMIAVKRLLEQTREEIDSGPLYPPESGKIDRPEPAR